MWKSTEKPNSAELIKIFLLPPLNLYLTFLACIENFEELCLVSAATLFSIFTIQQNGTWIRNLNEYFIISWRLFDYLSTSRIDERIFQSSEHGLFIPTSLFPSFGKLYSDWGNTFCLLHSLQYGLTFARLKINFSFSNKKECMSGSSSSSIDNYLLSQ